MKDLKKIANEFKIKGNINEIIPITTGLINQTYKVVTEGDAPDYILQSKNASIFPNVPAMMDNILKVTEHIRNKVIAEGGNPDREVMTVITTSDGKPFYKDEDGEDWAMSLFIPETTSYDVATDAELARKGGIGIGRFQKYLSDFTEPLYQTIEGFHDLAFRFKQWEDALKNGKPERIEEAAKEIEWVENRRRKMEEFWKQVEAGVLPKRVTHNDTKLSNILFDKDENVLCVIDLDTVMSNTPLADYGDAIRTFANTGAEDDENLDNIRLDVDKYNAYTEGYLSEVEDMLTDAEKKYLSFGPQYIIYEQVMRFLMDYLQGDTYYKINYPKHNLVRTRAQMKLLEEIERHDGI